jgi:hypothetical protein
MTHDGLRRGLQANLVSGLCSASSSTSGEDNLAFCNLMRANSVNLATGQQMAFTW